MAERVGFEPTVSLHPQRFSRPSRSTTLAPLREVRTRMRGRSKGRAIDEGEGTCQALLPHWASRNAKRAYMLSARHINRAEWKGSGA